MKNYLLLVLVLGLTALTSACATRDENGNIVERECRSSESLGSRIERRTCMSPEQWAIYDKEAEERLALNGRQKDEFFREAMNQGSQAQGRSFDTPGGPQ